MELCCAKLREQKEMKYFVTLHATNILSYHVKALVLHVLLTSYIIS